MEIIILAVIALVVIGIIVRQVVKSGKGQCCGCRMSQNNRGCSQCLNRKQDT